MTRMDVARFCVIMRRSLTNSHTKRQRQRLEEMQAEMDYIFETISKNNEEENKSYSGFKDIMSGYHTGNVEK